LFSLSTRLPGNEQLAFTECEFSIGGTIIPELLIIETVDDNGKAVADGEPGYFVITTLPASRQCR